MSRSICQIREVREAKVSSGAHQCARAFDEEIFMFYSEVNVASSGGLRPLIDLIELSQQHARRPFFSSTPLLIYHFDLGQKVACLRLLDIMD